jgi:hypothetical protein
MTTAEATLAAVQANVRRRNSSQPIHADHECVAICPSADGFDVDFWGDAAGESYGELMEALGSPAVAETLRTLSIRGPDVGANGTRNWDLTALVGKGAPFPRLESVKIQQTAPSDHNKSIVAASYDEEGVLARLLSAAPNLSVLISPSAPNAEFFAPSSRPIGYLDVDAGYDTQNFIRNLARSTCFPELYSVAWGEYNETYMEDFAQQTTPIEDYRELFTSQALARVRAFEWRNPALGDDQIRELRRLRGPDFSLKVVRYSSDFVK